MSDRSMAKPRPMSTLPKGVARRTVLRKPNPDVLVAAVGLWPDATHAAPNEHVPNVPFPINDGFSIIGNWYLADSNSVQAPDPRAEVHRLWGLALWGMARSDATLFGCVALLSLHKRWSIASRFDKVLYLDHKQQVYESLCKSVALSGGNVAGNTALAIALLAFAEVREGMCRAYEILGYPNPYHFSSIWANAKDCDMWMEAFRAKFDGIGTFEKEQWDALLRHCGVVTDQPAILFSAELLEAYPDAKVVIVERDVESWYRSIKALFATSLDSTFLAVRFKDPFWIGRIIEVGVTSFGYAFGQAKTPTAAGLEKRAKQGYREHNAIIRDLVPKEKRLEYKLGSGWEPLCEFLGKPVPDVPFPHFNELKDLKALFEWYGLKALKHSVVNLGLLLAVVVVPLVGIYFARR